MKKLTLILLVILSFINVSSQDEAGNFFIGVNVGGYFANKNTAIMYTGSNVAVRGIEFYFPTSYGGSASASNFHPEIDDYFDYDYKIENDGFPASPRYKAAVDVGIHAGVKLGNGHAIFVDVNSSNIKFEQFFSLTVEDPNGTPKERFEQIPLFGEEKRLNVNLGTQISFYNEESINAYFSLFGNFNSTRLQKNYFVLNNRQYQIIHYTYGTNNLNPGGNGFGGGAGLGANVKFNDQFTFGLAYNLIYTKTNMNEVFHPFGIHHGLTFRVIWG